MRQCDQIHGQSCGCGKCGSGSSFQGQARILTLDQGIHSCSGSPPDQQDSLTRGEVLPSQKCSVDSEAWEAAEGLGHYQQELCHIQKAISEMGSCSSKSKTKHSVFQLDPSQSKELLQITTTGSSGKLKTIQCTDGKAEEALSGPLSASSFSVHKLKASIDKKPTTVDEKSSCVLKYRTPHFRAVGTVEIPALSDKHRVQIGWIQTCTHMKFVNTYGNEGITSWEFPEIESGKYTMVSDSDGKQYPWYGAKHEVTTVNGPSPRQMVSVHMNDNFFPQVTWYIPRSMYDRSARLTHVHRKQRFYTFLVAKDLVSGDHHVLRTISWAMELNIKVNPRLPQGKRAQIDKAVEQEQPRFLDNNPITLETHALSPPNANNSQALLWRPTSGDPRVVVPPVQTTVNLEKYVIATRDLGKTLVKCGKDKENVPVPSS